MTAAATRDGVAVRQGAPAACVKQKDLSRYMGTYRVTGVKRYGGGMTGRAQAMRHVGKPMVTLSSARVVVSGNRSIEHPVYGLACQPRPHEGEVVPPAARHSNFYGYGMGRKTVSVLRVSDPSDQDPTPYYIFELLHVGNKLEIGYMDDGWLYTLERKP